MNEFIIFSEKSEQMHKNKGGSLDERFFANLFAETLNDESFEKFQCRFSTQYFKKRENLIKNNYFETHRISQTYSNTSTALLTSLTNFPHPKTKRNYKPFQAEP